MNYKIVLLFLLSIFVCACAPGLGTSLGIPSVTYQASSDNMAPPIGLSKINILPFKDQRINQELCEIDGRKLLASFNTGEYARSLVVDYFREHKVRVSNFSTPIIDGEIHEWLSVVTPGFPLSKLNAKANLILRVYAQENKLLYTGKYYGSVSFEHPLLDQARIEESLGRAMQEALNQAFSDQGFVDSLQRGTVNI